ncbi:hypothetical protein [Legionella fallonii]|nr:hypothetical protein [Legionella fallonii]
MPNFQTTDGQTQVIIPLQIKPFSHKAMPTITGNALSDEAGTVLYGLYNMEYLLPGEDRLRLIANHNQKTVQLMLFTHNPELLKSLPGGRPSSLVADTISRIHRYRIKSESYKKPLTHAQQEKLRLANECISSLMPLLKQERHLDSQDHAGHEELRREVIFIIEHCRDGNRMLANDPLVSEGSLGYLLYDARQAAQHYQFNRVYAISRQDQLDFTKIKNRPLRKLAEEDEEQEATKPFATSIEFPMRSSQEPPCFIWDSEIHIGHASDDLDDALRVICHHYNLVPASNLNDIPASRLAKVEAFFRKLWRDGQDWIEYLSFSTKPEHKTEVSYRSHGISITKITPYYKLQGLAQKGYDSLDQLICNLTGNTLEPKSAKTLKEAQHILGQLPNDHWIILAETQQILLRQQDKLITINYFIKENKFYPLPSGQDLYVLSQVSKKHLYWPERLSLKMNAFISRIPSFFNNFFKRLSHFIVHDLHEEFFTHVHATHTQNTQDHDTNPHIKTQKEMRHSLHEALENNGLLNNGQTLEEFIKEQINSSPYVIAKANHPPSPPAYENPLHRFLGVIRHLASFFIDTGERDPIVGTLAMAAYVYGAGAIIAPDKLAEILTKLHLSGLIAGIEPTQKLAHWMSHGTRAEAISASATYWQASVASGNLDKFFVNAINILKEDPAEVAIIAALALSLGYGITKAVPSLQQEIGDFPYTTYAALGGKGGAALYDTIMHPGEDWLLGTCKWFFKNIINIAKLVIAPFVEGYYYGYEDGFIRGWAKSFLLAKQLGKQLFAASMDLALAVLTIPLLELSALLIHTPFRGITNFFRKLLSTLGNIKSLGQLFISFAERPSLNNYLADFRLSLIYGFTSPFGYFSDNVFLNAAMNSIRLVFIPPLQLIKNIIILPLLDLLSLTFRLSLSIINPASRVIAYLLGSALYAGGDLWDNSIGILFSSSATGLTLVCDWLDNLAGEVKQHLLSFIEIIRGQLYYWAFHQEDAQVHSTEDKLEYFTKEPRRFELIPHSESHCLLHQLLDEENNSFSENIDTPPPVTHYEKLFKEAAPVLRMETNQETYTMQM